MDPPESCFETPPIIMCNGAFHRVVHDNSVGIDGTMWKDNPSSYKLPAKSTAAQIHFPQHRAVHLTR